MVEVSSFVYFVVFALIIFIGLTMFLTCLILIGFMLSLHDVTDEGIEVSETPQSGISDQYAPCPDALYTNICSFV